MIYTIKPEVKRPDVALYKDIVYKNAFNSFRQCNCGLTLDYIRPYYELQKWEKVPLLIWAEGGAWRTSPPARRIPELSYYAYHGYAVASVQYRVSSQSLWPAQIEDLKTAIRYLKAHADQLGNDTERVAIAGESAGAHLAAMAALTGGKEVFSTSEWNEVSDEVQAAICWYCPGDFTVAKEQADISGYVCDPRNLLVNEKMGENPQKEAEVSPVNYVDRTAPPFLLFHGSKDPLVPAAQSRSLYEKLVENEVEADYYLLEDAGHASIEFSQEEIQTIMLKFLDRHLKGGETA